MNSCKHTRGKKRKAKKLNQLVNIKRLVCFIGVRYWSKSGGGGENRVSENTPYLTCFFSLFHTEA